MTGSLRVIFVKLLVFTLFTLAVTGLLAAVIGNIQPFTAFYPVRAEFADATGLLETDVVKVAGVTIGKVAGAEVEVVDGRAKAIVHMRIERGVTLPENVHAAIRFRNLVGQRMIVLSRDADEPDAPPLPQDGTALIPIEQTRPAFDLGVVFNNLRPVLRALDPEDANIVSRAMIQVFAGREGTVQAMIGDLADLSEALGRRGPVLAELIRELDSVVGNLAQRDTEIQSILSDFDLVMQTLANRSTHLARALENIGVTSDELAGLIADNRPELDVMIAQLADILDVAARHRDDLDETLRRLPDTTHGLLRATTYGEWANLNIVCLEGSCEPGLNGAGAQGGGLTDILGTALRGTSR